MQYFNFMPYEDQIMTVKEFFESFVDSLLNAEIDTTFWKVFLGCFFALLFGLLIQKLPASIRKIYFASF